MAHRGRHRRVSSYVGLLVSYHFDLAAGATVVLVASAIFFGVFLSRRGARPAPAAGRGPAAPATGPA